MPFAVRAAARGDAGQIAALAGVLGYSPDMAAAAATLEMILGRDDRGIPEHARQRRDIARRRRGPPL